MSAGHDARRFCITAARIVYNKAMEIRHGAVTWLDVRLYPQDEDGEPDPALQELAARFHLHPVIVKELEVPSTRARVETYDHHLFMIYQFPIWDPVERVSRRGEIDLIVTGDCVVTVRYDELTPIREFARRVEDEDFANAAFGNTLQLSYYILGEILNFNQRQLRHIREKVEEAASGLFKDNELEMVKHISYLKRDLSEYRIIFRPQTQVLNSFLAAGKKFWGPESEPYLSDLEGNHLRLMNQLEDLHAGVRDFESTNNQLLNIKGADVMQKLTVAAFLTFPLVLFASLFTVHLQGIPLTTHPYGFWIMVGIMIIAAAGMLSYFKWKKWL
jgi:magnesium transporter